MGMDVTRLLDRLRRRHRPDAAQLSAYIDGRLEPAQRVALEAHLGTCDGCRDRLDGLRAVSTTLRTMPQASVPRSFRLRPPDVELARAPERPVPAAPWLRAMPALSAVALVAFAVLVTADLRSSATSAPGRSSPTGAAARVPANGAAAPAPEKSAAGNATGMLDYADQTAETGDLDRSQLQSTSGASPTPPPTAMRTEGAAFDAPATATADASSTFNAIAPTEPAEKKLEGAPTSTGELAPADGGARDQFSPATSENNDDHTALRIGEAAAALIAIAATAATAALWLRRRDVHRA